jgi:hypothetical protein
MRPKLRVNSGAPCNVSCVSILSIHDLSGFRNSVSPSSVPCYLKLQQKMTHSLRHLAASFRRCFPYDIQKAARGLRDKPAHF